MRYLELKSPFLERIFPPTFLLSTSQTPMNQCEEMEGIDPALRMKIVTAGGGFGPVADRGYGVSYIIVGEDRLFFHISSKVSADNTVIPSFSCLILNKSLSAPYSRLSHKDCLSCQC